MNSLIVRDNGIHVTDGEVTVICQDQEQAENIIFQYLVDNPTVEAKHDHPYQIPNLRFTVKEELEYPTTYSPYRKVAILSVEEETVKEESQDDGCKCQRCGLIYRIDIMVQDDLWEKIKPEGKPQGAGLLCHYCVIDGFLDSLDKTKFQAFSIKIVSDSSTDNYGMQSIRLHP